MALVRPRVEVASDVPGLTRMAKLGDDEAAALSHIELAQRSGNLVVPHRFRITCHKRGWSRTMLERLVWRGFVSQLEGTDRYSLTDKGKAAELVYREWNRARVQTIDGEEADGEVDGLAWEGLRKRA